MTEITDPLPEGVAADLTRLCSVLNAEVPAEALDCNLLIATWNIRAFGDLTEKWESSEEDTPKRDLHSLLCIAEIVVPQEQLGPIESGALRRQFARTPYAVSFRSGEETFVLVMLHVLYGENEEERLPEIKAIIEWLAGWARDINSWDHNLIALGDFDIDRRGDVLHDAFISTGLDIPLDLQEVPRTIFSDLERPELNKSTTRSRGSRVEAACQPSLCTTLEEATSTSPSLSWPHAG